MMRHGATSARCDEEGYDERCDDGDDDERRRTAITSVLRERGSTGRIEAARRTDGCVASNETTVLPRATRGADATSRNQM